MIDPYPFIHLMNIPDDKESCSILTKLYRFKSLKSNKKFIVRVEIYPHSVYVVKFFDKSLSNCPNRYSILTNDKEPRRVIMTCICILKSLHEEDNKSSFAFIGTNCIDEPKKNTKRFRVYKTIVTTQFGDSVFAHFTNEDNSAYLLLRQTELEANKNLLLDIQNQFHKVYEFSN